MISPSRNRLSDRFPGGRPGTGRWQASGSIVRRFGRAVVVTTMAYVSSVVAAPSAGAHSGATDEGTASNFRTRILAVVPSNELFSVRVVDAGSRLELASRSDEVVIEGYQGEPYLMIGPAGVFENERSPATYLNQQRRGVVDVPAIADPTSPPVWRKISAGSVARWHDHRAHWMSPDPPPAVTLQPAVEQVIFDRWAVPVIVGGARVEIVGDLTWVPPPSRTRWLLTTLVVGALAWATLRRVGEPLSRVALLLVVCTAEMVATLGVVAASVEPFMDRVSRFVVIAAMAAAAAHAVAVRGRAERDVHLGVALAGLTGAAVTGASRIDAFSYSQLATSLDTNVDRSMTVICIGVGAALFADFIASLASRNRKEPI